MTDEERKLLDLQGAVIRYLAANHAGVEASHRDPTPGCEVDLQIRTIIELRDAAQAIAEALE